MVAAAHALGAVVMTGDRIFGAELVVGKRYRAEMEDCCIEGEFEAVLIDKNMNEYGAADRLVFGNGVTLTTWGQIMFTEVVL